jgi:DNA primase
MSQCPAHADKSPSLSVCETADGRILIHCFAGCGVHDVLDALGLEMKDLYPERLADHLPAQRTRAHAHAAANVLKMMAHEALVIVVAVEAIKRGEVLSDVDHLRMVEAATVLRQAAAHV